MDGTTVNPLDSSKFFGTTPAATAPASTLDMQTFLKLLTTQLANQNPLEPMNDRDFFAQMAQLGTVQGIDQLKSSQEITQANSLVGKIVTAARDDATSTSSNPYVTGVVRGLRIQNGERLLQVQEADGGIVDVKMGNIQDIISPDTSGSTDKLVNLANSAALIGKTVNAPHPTLKGTDGNPETISAAVKSVSFEKGSIFLTVKDRLSNDVKINLKDVLGFSN